MKKYMMVTLLALTLNACSTPSASPDKYDSQTCLQVEQGLPEKQKACEEKAEMVQQMPTVEEAIPSLEYQKCLQDRKDGNDQNVARDCGKIWQQSHAK